jgi:hypothetical protein
MTSAAIAQATNELRDLPRDDDGPVFREPWEQFDVKLLRRFRYTCRFVPMYLPYRTSR